MQKVGQSALEIRNDEEIGHRNDGPDYSKCQEYPTGVSHGLLPSTKKPHRSRGGAKGLAGNALAQLPAISA